MGKKLHLFGEENTKMGKEYGNFGHFSKIEVNFFLDQQQFSSPSLQKADLANPADILTSVLSGTCPLYGPHIMMYA